MFLLQYRMFGFRVKELFKCKGDPCPNTVDCFISRPMEKTIFLWFMFIISALCLFLNVLELIYLFWQVSKMHFTVQFANLDLQMI